MQPGSRQPKGGAMGVYVGERDVASGVSRVWVVNQPPRPDITEIVEVLARLRALTEPALDADPAEDSRRRTELIARKDALVAQREAAEASPPPVELKPHPTRSWAEQFD